MKLWWQEYQTILFDLDGTLIDSALDLSLCFNDILEKHGFSAIPQARLAAVSGMGSKAMMQETEIFLKISFTDAEKNAIRQDFFSHYRANLLNNTRPFNGAEPLLQDLKHANKQVILATNKPSFLTLPTITGLGWDDLFDKIVCSDNVSQAKPHPQHLLEAMPQYIDLTQCAMVGDTDADYQAAIACPMTIFMTNAALLQAEKFPKALFLKENYIL